MERIRHLIPRSIQKAGITRGVEAHEIIEAAETAFKVEFGENGSRAIKPLYFKNRTLTISCTSAACAQEVKLHEGALVLRINTRLNRQVLDRIRYLL